jgi:hypothetical protein
MSLLCIVNVLDNKVANMPDPKKVNKPKQKKGVYTVRRYKKPYKRDRKQ